MVAHYSGSLGHSKFRQKVARDTQEILRDICPVLPGIWKGWVFGGISLIHNPQLKTTTEGQTKALIDAVRHELKINQYFPVNALRNNPAFQAPEMNDGYVGHFSVALDLGTGDVKWG
jgi:hypothetical protein